jgi:hypothetical protein
MASTISAGTTAGTALNMTGDTTGNLAFQTGAGANTITVPNGTGTIAVNGVSTNIVSGTAVASTSGTSIDFTSIPSWVKRVTVMFNNVSLNSSGYIRLQLGVSGTPETTGYTSGSSLISSAGGVNYVSSTSGVDLFGASAAYALNGNIVFTVLGSNIWTFTGSTTNTTTTVYTQNTAGSKTLAGTLNMIRITSSTGTDTFDAGSINILYE